jgi:hypothetical protein
MNTMSLKNMFFFFSVAIILFSCQAENSLDRNLIVNPGFEETSNSDPVAWEMLASDDAKIFQAGIVKQSHSGNNAMMFGRIWAKEWVRFGIKTENSLSIDPGNKYLLSFWYKTEGIDEYPLPLVVRLNVHRQNESSPLRYDKNLSTRQEWTQIHWLIDTLPPDAKDAELSFFLWIRTRGKVLVDDVEFKIADQESIGEYYTWRTLPEPAFSYDAENTTFPATGFFEVKHDESRWWLVGPEGNPTWAIATMGEIPGTSGNGNIMLSEWFEKTYQGDRMEYAKMQYALLEDWGINSLAGWTADEYSILTEERYNADEPWFPIYKVLNFSIMGADKVYYAKNNKGELKGRYDHSFPDPFNPEWREDARQKALNNIDRYKGKAWFAGWFMDNEIDYGSLFLYIWGDYSAMEFIKFLQAKYEDIDQLNASWTSDFGQYSYASFDDILSEKPSPAEWDDPLYPDFIEFERIMMKEYIDYTYDMVKELDPDHLIISNRLNLGPMGSLYRTIDLWSKYDVICVNIYPENLFFGFNKGELEILDWVYEKTGKPVILGEWSIPAFDSNLYDFDEDPYGRPLDWSWPQVLRDQKERGQAYRTCMLQLASKPYLLGAAWFKVLDVNSETRRANRGLIDDNHQPYQDFIETFRSTNLDLMNTMNLTR